MEDKSELIKTFLMSVEFSDRNDIEIKISKSGENYLTICYERMSAVFVEAIKELTKEIKELKNENVIMKNEIELLKSSIGWINITINF